jgi:hypothetical protein
MGIYVKKDQPFAEMRIIFILDRSGGRGYSLKLYPLNGGLL